MESIQFEEPMENPKKIVREEAYKAWNNLVNTNPQGTDKVPLRSAEEVLAYFKEISSRLSFVLACFFEYYTWTEDLIVDMTKDIYLKEPVVTKEELAQLTEAQLFEAGFRHYSEESDLLLIPIHLYRALHPEMEVICFTDGEVCRLKDIDKDVRFGILAYGIKDYLKDDAHPDEL